MAFQWAAPVASIINFGEIKVGSGGSAFLIAEKIENHGVLMAPDGTLGLYAGKQVLMSERPDGRGLSVEVRLPEGSVDNQGQLVADAGSILVHAQTVNQNGLVQANSVRERNGVIELLASDSVSLGANSVVAAEGDARVRQPWRADHGQVRRHVRRCRGLARFGRGGRPRRPRRPGGAFRALHGGHPFLRGRPGAPRLRRRFAPD